MVDGWVLLMHVQGTSPQHVTLSQTCGSHNGLLISERTKPFKLDPSVNKLLRERSGQVGSAVDHGIKALSYLMKPLSAMKKGHRVGTVSVHVLN